MLVDIMRSVMTRQKLYPSTSSAEKLVDALGLLDALFSEQSRPSLGWLRCQMRRKTIPYYRVGRLVRFDPEEVRTALTQKFLVNAQPQRALTTTGGPN